MDYSLTLLEDKLYIIERTVNVPTYDYDFELNHRCKHPIVIESGLPGILRVGAVENYSETYLEFLALGIRIINTPEQHRIASELTAWYPLVEKYTPKSIWFDQFPPYEDLKNKLGAKIFIKGSRQTSKHDPSLCIVNNENDYLRIKEEYMSNDILHWQTIVAREYIELQPAKGTVPGKVPPKVEFRTFWYKGNLVGFGQYWYQIAPYEISRALRDSGVEFAKRISNLIQIPFVAIDIGLTVENKWTLIECNDGQESGYTSISPKLIWETILNS